jgi:hypothetical protein
MKVFPAVVLALAAIMLWPARTSIAHSAALQYLTRHFTALEQQSGRYQYLPFDVPAGTTRIVISYRYDRRGGANAIDLGLFEPGPLTPGTAAYRGSSGGERDTVTIAVDEATPGYWPGPIPTGEWHVMLGLYKVAREGVDVEVRIETSRQAPSAPSPSLAAQSAAPLRRGPAWYAGALHAHTNHSDGALSPAQLADKARAEGLDFIAITDHNNTSHQLARTSDDLLVITGEEVTTPGGHFNVWGLGGPRDYIEFRLPAGDPALERTMAGARTRGALISVNHPAAACFACAWTHAIPDSVNAIEVSEHPPQALAIWDVLLRQGRRLTAVGTSDWHRGNGPLGSPSVKVWATDLSTPAILAGLRAGHVVVVADPAVPAPDLTVRTADRVAKVGDELRVARGQVMRVALSGEPAYEGARVELIWNGESVDSAVMSGAAAVVFERVAITTGYLRVHVSRSDGSSLVITNPIYIVVS